MNQNKLRYRLGLDLGIASVGWCVLGDKRIIDIGVRTFDRAEVPKTGESLNLARRTARLTRRRLHRRLTRLRDLRKILVSKGLVDSSKFHLNLPPALQDAWALRVQGLDRLLTGTELAVVIYHVCKHRGFHWISKSEALDDSDSSSETGRVKVGLANTRKLLKEKGYRTAAEMIVREFPDSYRNKAGSYEKSLARVLLADELQQILDFQKQLGSGHITDNLILELLGNGDQKSGLLWKQEPPLSGEQLLKMLGFCSLERQHGQNEHRAPKASFLAERHVWLTRLNNLRLIHDGRSLELSPEQRQLLLNLPFESKSDIKYSDVRKLFKKQFGFPDTVRFKGLIYPSERDKTLGAKDPENAILGKAAAFHEIRKLFDKKGLSSVFTTMSTEALAGNSEKLDLIARILSIYKEDEEARAMLKKAFPTQGTDFVEALLELRFDKFHNLSLKALSKVVPKMLQGLRFDEAVEAAGYKHAALPAQKRTPYLPSLYLGSDRSGRLILREDIDVPRNPVVLRTLTQAIKVVNAIIRKHGLPDSVHIEMARDLSRPLDERRKVEKEQLKYRDLNQSLKDELREHFNLQGSIKGDDFWKFRLYREQECKCAYSLKPIDLNRLFDTGYLEVDHALPYSRSFDDSKNNKVLVLASENRNKGNKTPYEYLTQLDGGQEGPRWEQFKVFVSTNKSYRQAKRNNLLKKDFVGEEAEGFRDRHLQDTRYICRFFKGYVESHLQLADESTAQRCVVVSGQLTSFLRARWGILKVRDESDRHHALDAAVIASCSHGMVKRLSDYARRKELKEAACGYVDPETGEIVDVDALRKLENSFPTPFPNFRDELTLRVKCDNLEVMKAELAKAGNYDEDALLKLRTLFVSRAVQRRNKGPAHKETVYAVPSDPDLTEGAVIKVSLDKIKESDLDNLVEPHRNARLYEAIRQRLKEFGGKAEKAFAPDNPFYMPTNDPTKRGPQVRAVRKIESRMTGIQVRGGKAANGSCARVDIFEKGGKFYMIPVYEQYRGTGKLPMNYVKAATPQKDWPAIDETFEWKFSLYPNDLVSVKKGAKTLLGYYVGNDVAVGTIGIKTHDGSDSDFKDGLWRVGIQSLDFFQKLSCTVLAEIHPWKAEDRNVLA